MGKAKYDWSQADLMLGTMPDSELGAMFGIPTTSVYRRRRSRGIAACGRRSGGDKYAAIRGEIPDEAVARIARVSVETAGKWRRDRGIDKGGGTRERLVQWHLTNWLNCPYKEYVFTPYGVIDVLTDDAIYEVEYDLSTARAHSAIGKLVLLRLAQPGRRLVIACRKVASGAPRRLSDEQLATPPGLLSLGAERYGFRGAANCAELITYNWHPTKPWWMQE